jgi:hypothetical protein
MTKALNANIPNLLRNRKWIRVMYSDDTDTNRADRAQSDILTRMSDVIKEVQLARDSVTHEVRRLRLQVVRLNERQKVMEKGLCPNNPALSAALDKYDEETRHIKEEDEANDLYSNMEQPAKRFKAETNGLRFTPPDAAPGDDAADSDDGSESHAAANVPPGEPAIPIGHTTGAAKILQWHAVAAMVGEKMKREKNRGLDPLRRERKRGTISLYGRGESCERLVGYDNDSMSDYGLDPARSISDTYSDPAHSPVAEQGWGQGGAQSPQPDSYLFSAEKDAIRAAVDAAPPTDLDEKTVRHLAASYMRYLNVMHPIITQKSLDAMIAKFMQNIGATERDGAGHNFARFAGSTDATGSKRKRSPTLSGTDHTYAQQLGHGWRQRTISEAIVLLILALGKVCEHQSKIPDVVLETDGSTTNSPANHVSPPIVHQSPKLSSHSSTLPSPIMQDRAYHHRGSSDTSSIRYPANTRNLDVIPGLAYFGVAMDILGNHHGGSGLPYVHALLLASLYYSQLGRVLQSHACVHQAGYALTMMLKP